MSRFVLDADRWVRPPVTVRDVAEAPRDVTQLRVERDRRHIEAVADFERLHTVEVVDADDHALRALSRCRALRALALRRVRASSLDSLEELRGLEVLVVEDAAVTSLDSLAYLSRLARLSLSYLPRVRRLDAVGGLARLQALRLEADDDPSARRRWRVDTLAPLAALVSLRALRLMIDVGDDSLAALDHVPLDVLEMRVGFPVEELGRFAGRHPGLARTVSPLTRYEVGACRRCARATVVPRCGGPPLCRACDAAAVADLEERWRAARDAAAA